MKQISRRQFIGRSAAGGLALAGLPAFLNACAKSDDETETGGSVSPFSMQAAWINDAEFIGYFVALSNGYFTEEGLDLNYLSGGPDVIPESSLLSGISPLALTSPDATIKAIADDGAPFVIVGTQYQKNPIGIVSLKKSNINEPKDLIGKTLAVPPANTITVEAMLKLNGIDKSQLTIVPYVYDPTPLVKGEIDASMDFTTNVPYTISQMGEEASSFLLYDFGVTLFNDTIVVTKDALASQRELIVKWLRASRRGWEENFKDTTKYPPTFAETHFKGTGRTIDNEVFFNGAQKPIIESEGGIFSMSDEGIENNLKALSEIGINGTKEMFDTSLLAEI